MGSAHWYSIAGPYSNEFSMNDRNGRNRNTLLSILLWARAQHVGFDDEMDFN